MPDSKRVDAVRNRLAILDAALAEFATYGLTAPVDRIAARAGVGPGTLYRHFPTKNDLVASVVAHRVDQIAGFADGSIQSSPAGTAIFDVLDELARTASEDQAFGEVLATNDAALIEASSSATERFSDILSMLLDDAHAAGTVHPTVDLDTLRAVVSASKAAALSVPDDATLDQVCGVLRRGLSA